MECMASLHVNVSESVVVRQSLFIIDKQKSM